MTEGFISEIPVEIADSIFKDYGPADWAGHFIDEHGFVEGDEQKAWLIDQVARVLLGTPVIVVEVQRPGRPTEYRVRTGEPSVDYLYWSYDNKRPERGNAFEEACPQAVAP